MLRITLLIAHIYVVLPLGHTLAWPDVHLDSESDLESVLFKSLLFHPETALLVYVLECFCLKNPSPFIYLNYELNNWKVAQLDSESEFSPSWHKFR